jgi:hypothetical protein
LRTGTSRQYYHVWIARGRSAEFIRLRISDGTSGTTGFPAGISRLKSALPWLHGRTGTPHHGWIGRSRSADFGRLGMLVGPSGPPGTLYTLSRLKSALRRCYARRALRTVPQPSASQQHPHSAGARFSGCKNLGICGERWKMAGALSVPALLQALRLRPAKKRGPRVLPEGLLLKCFELKAACDAD